MADLVATLLQDEAVSGAVRAKLMIFSLQFLAKLEADEGPSDLSTLPDDEVQAVLDDALKKVDVAT